MDKSEKLDFLIDKLLKEQPRYKHIKIPANVAEKKILFRSLLNIRPAVPVNEDFLHIQDEYLQEELLSKGITDIKNLKPIKDGMYLWKGDITLLRTDAIVNAANSGLLGCFVPCHGCIDNAIHTYAGVQLRLECAKLMEEQGHPEAAGTAKITKAYNLPSRYILHTVGPIIRGQPTKLECQQLEDCYHSCLELADKNGLESLAFCCISTGEFHFPNQLATEIAVGTVSKFLLKASHVRKVIFNVFKERDYEIYKSMLE